MTDQELVKKTLDGDMNAFSEIVGRYQRKILAFAINTLGNKQDAEDVCQDAFVKVYHNLGKYDPRFAFKTWFYTLTNNLCIDRLRRKKTQFNFINKMKIEPEIRKKKAADNPGPSQLSKQKYLQKLTPREKTSVILWANEGCTAEEIAGILKCSASTARVYLFRARKKIKMELNHEHTPVS